MERVRTEKEYIGIMTKILHDKDVKERIIKMRERIYDEFMVFCHGHNIDGEKLMHDYINRYGCVMSYMSFNLLLHDDIGWQEAWKEIQNKIVFPFLISFIKKLGNDDYRLLRHCFVYEKFVFKPIENVGIYNLYSHMKNAYNLYRHMKNTNLLSEQINYWDIILMDVTNVKKRYEKKG